MWLLYAALAAVCFGIRGILYQRTSKMPVDRNTVLFGVYICGAFAALLLNLVFRQPWTPGAWVGVLMGVFSFASNAAMYKGFSVGKASLVAIFTGLAPAVSAGLAYLRWGETLSAAQGAAFAVILAGIVMIRYSNDLSWRRLQGVQWALLAMLFFGITDVCTKQATLWNGQTLPSLGVMYITGSIFFGVLAASGRARTRKTALSSAASANAGDGGGEAAAAASIPETGYPPAGSAANRPGMGENPGTGHGETAAAAETGPARPKPWKVMPTLLWGMVVGTSNISGMLLIVPAFRLGTTGLVSAIVALNVIIFLLYARLILKEKFSALETAGAALAIAGLLILRLAG